MAANSSVLFGISDAKPPSRHDCGLEVVFVPGLQGTTQRGPLALSPAQTNLGSHVRPKLHSVPDSRKAEDFFVIASFSSHISQTCRQQKVRPLQRILRCGTNPLCRRPPVRPGVECNWCPAGLSRRTGRETADLEVCRTCYRYTIARTRSAGFQTRCVADSQTGWATATLRSAGLETCDTCLRQAKRLPVCRMQTGGRQAAECKICGAKNS